MRVFNVKILKIVLVAGAVLSATSSNLIARDYSDDGVPVICNVSYVTRYKTEKIFVPAKMDCAKNNSSFADFSSSCNYTPAYYDEIQTPYTVKVTGGCREYGNAGNR